MQRSFADQESAAAGAQPGEVQQQKTEPTGDKLMAQEPSCKSDKSSAGGLYSDQQNIDAECEKLLRNTKKQVKQMMEEAVTKKFIHEDSSIIIALCVAVDACLSHGLKRRALGLFKTSSSTALIQKVSKNCKSAQEVLDTVEYEERKTLCEQQRQQQNVKRASTGSNPTQRHDNNGSANNLTKASSQKSPAKQVTNYMNVHKRNRWIKVALIDKKLVSIVDHLAENASKYYEPDALMANCLCAQILSSLLVGPSALEFSRSKTNDLYQFEDPSADELLKRHKLANPIACLCNKHPPNSNNNNQLQNQQQPSLNQKINSHSDFHTKLSRSATDTPERSIQGDSAKRAHCRQTNSYNLVPSNNADRRASVDARKHLNASDDSTLAKMATSSSQQQAASGCDDFPERRSPSPHRGALIRSDSRRRPLALKTNSKRGTLVTDCHHYSCQEISEHQQTKGYSFLCISSTTTAPTTNTFPPMKSPLATGGGNGGCVDSVGGKTCIHANSGQQYHVHQDWSPRMLHETLHQNSKSNLLYAKNNVLLETQPNETMAGYLSLHQTSSDLILKWIPNQMINGSQQQATPSGNNSSPIQIEEPTTTTTITEPSNQADNSATTTTVGCPNSATSGQQKQPTAVESSYLDLVVSLSVSRIVLLQCQFGGYNFRSLASEQSCSNGDTADGPSDPSSQTDNADEAATKDAANEKAARVPPRPCTEETLILVEADGVQRAPFKFPKGGLRLFLSCLESGLRPEKYLDPAVKFYHLGSSDPLHSPNLAPTTGDSWSSQGRWLFSSSKTQSDSLGLDSPSAGSETSQGSSSRFDSLLRRLPSLKRRTQGDNQPPQENPDVSLGGTGNEPPSSSPGCFATDNYVYRIVSIQQPDWPLPTPPHSALSVGPGAGCSSTSSSPAIVLGHANSRHLTHGSSSSDTSGQKFRWSLSRLAKFSARYTSSAGSASCSSMPCNGTINYSTNGDSLSSFSQTSNQKTTMEDTFETTNGCEQQLAAAGQGKDSSKELARIEAKLDDLKKSTSDEILAWRTQSVQTLCESMRKQILARAFYGWLAHCRKARIIRAHLVKLVKPEEVCCLVSDFEELPESGQDNNSRPGESSKLASVQEGLTRAKWNELLRNESKLDEEHLARQVNQLVYYGGVESNELRVEVWPYLLGHYRFTDSKAKRLAKDQWARECYESLGRDWIKIERVVKQRDQELLAANMARASRDAGKDAGANCSGRSISETSDEIIVSGGGGGSTRQTQSKPTDSNNNNNDNSDITENDDDDDDEAQHCELDEQATETGNIGGQEEAKLAGATDETKAPENTRGFARRDKDPKLAPSKGSGRRRKRRRPRLESTGSVGSDASITDQYGNNIHRIDKDVQRCDRNFWYFKDAKNLEKLRNIMCTYVWQHLDVGYVQGMCDLAAPFLVIFDDELMAYNCFGQLMKRMESNFPHGNAMDQHFESLKHLIQILDPKLFDVLQSNGDYTHFYFCYRWLLLDFKRELCYQDVYRVWETIWSARVVVTDHFVVFMALAMVRYYRDIIIENNMDFTDTIKFFNEMAERHNAKEITALARDCIVELRNMIREMDL